MVLSVTQGAEQKFLDEWLPRFLGRAHPASFVTLHEQLRQQLRGVEQRMFAMIAAGYGVDVAEVRVLADADRNSPRQQRQAD